MRSLRYFAEIVNARRRNGGIALVRREFGELVQDEHSEVGDSLGVRSSIGIAAIEEIRQEFERRLGLMVELAVIAKGKVGADEWDDHEDEGQRVLAGEYGKQASQRGQSQKLDQKTARHPPPEVPGTRSGGERENEREENGLRAGGNHRCQQHGQKVAHTCQRGSLVGEREVEGGRRRHPAGRNCSHWRGSSMVRAGRSGHRVRYPPRRREYRESVRE
jgi:hypothetical protein